MSDRPDPDAPSDPRAIGDHRITSRRLDDGQGPALEIVEAVPVGAPSGAPLLFVHGAFGGAWQWSEIFLPYFAKRGRRAAAVSLRGHGGSAGREALRDQGLADFMADVRRVLAVMPTPPVLVGHSLGGLVAQRLIVQARLRGLVLLASLPPDGMALVGPRLALTDPLIWLEAFLGSVADAKTPVVAAAQQILFSESLPRERVARYAGLMTPESPRALGDAHLPGPVFSALLYRLPTLVLGGEVDRLVWRASILRTAFYHAATCRILPGMGHFLMLDAGAEGAARAMLDWLDAQGL